MRAIDVVWTIGHVNNQRRANSHCCANSQRHAKSGCHADNQAHANNQAMLTISQSLIFRNISIVSCQLIALRHTAEGSDQLSIGEPDRGRGCQSRRRTQ